jgi:isopenicillin N synthase-like dioxygenase
MVDAIPVIDVADHLAGRPGALHDLARRFHDALTTVGFMVITGHDVTQALIDQTFAEARRLHDLPMDTFARRMLAPLAVALNLPPGSFDEAFSESQFTLRLSHYPPVQAAANQFGIAPHTDSSFMTFLAQTEVPGLQVCTETGDWLDVPYVPGSFAVNSGDMMKRWTNGRFKSTPHRALPPVGRHRYAIPFFLGPQFDWKIVCLPTCTGPDNPPRWPPITYAAWQEYWYDANYDPKAQQDLVA